jgi:phage baseplate assembly protein V
MAQNQQQSNGGKWKYGIVKEIDPDKMMVRCEIPDMDKVLSPWLLIVVPNSLKNKDYSLPDLEEQIVILLDENSESGVAIGAVYSAKDTPAIADLDKRHVKFDDGTTVEYDRKTHKLEIKVKGDILIEATGDITLKGSRIDLNP